MLSAETVTVEGGGVISVLYDSGANVSIIAKGWVDEMNLQPVGGSSTREVELALGGKVWVETTPYEVKLVDKQGSVFKIRALAFQEPVARINNSMGAIEEAESMFDLARGTLGRTGTTAQLLLGADNMMYQPVCVRERENLRLMRTKFGLVVAGAMGRGGAREEGVVNSLRAQEENFLAIESLGTDPPRRCVRCQHCQECEFKIVQMSARHAKECELIKAGLSLDEEERRWVCTYPVRRDLEGLPDNKVQALRQAAQLETRLRKQGRLDEFNAVIQEGVERGVYRVLTAEEERSWPGTVHYTVFTEVYKTAPDATTPIRVCSNSSISYQGCSLMIF